MRWRRNAPTNETAGSPLLSCRACFCLTRIGCEVVPFWATLGGNGLGWTRHAGDVSNGEPG